MKETRLKALKEKANKLPKSPGVYIMKDRSGKIIYIGKAKALKNRVTQYFGSQSNHTEKVRAMVSFVDDFEYIICDSEFEALVLECSLIKQNKPKYNILLKDDKGYHYIKVTDEKWKRLESTHTNDGKGEFIGPYYSAFVAKDTVDSVNQIFKLPDCKRSFDKYTKPCLNYHIGRCDAPCKANIKLEDYLENVNNAVAFIKNGDTAALVAELNTRMEKAAENLEFEYAARLRDRITAIKRLKEKQKVVMCTYDNQDVFAAAFMGEDACVSVLIFRNGRLTDKKHYFVNGIKERSELYSEFLKSYYAQNDIPSRILTDVEVLDSFLLCEWLRGRRQKKVSFVLPKVGEQKRLVEMCEKNAADNLALHFKYNSKETATLNELAKLLGLANVPRYIEIYDISHTAGDQNVAGMVVYKDGKPHKKAYKRFKIKSFAGQNDYASMAEVLDRRFCEYENGTDEGFKTLPDLILLDGAAGQISAVEPVLRKHNIDVALFGLVKDEKHRTRAVATSGGDIAIKANKGVFTLLTAMQDEVHRFAITYHKQKRSKKMLNSEITSIKGIGDKKAAALFKHFKTLKAIKSASFEQLTALKEITKTDADAIINHFKNN